VDKMDNRNGNPLTHKSYYNYCYFYDETNLKVGGHNYGKIGFHIQHSDNCFGL
jgi:hypothetical protein